MTQRAEDSATDSQTAAKTPDLDNFDTARLTSALLLQMGFTPPQLMDWLREDLKISADYSDTVARAHCRRAVRVAASEAGHQQQRLCSGGKCGCGILFPHQRWRISGGKVSRSSTRAYETAYAAHVLGLVGRFPTTQMS